MSRFKRNVSRKRDKRLRSECELKWVLMETEMNKMDLMLFWALLQIVVTMSRAKMGLLASKATTRKALKKSHSRSVERLILTRQESHLCQRKKRLSNF